jgi:hypothetical protein
VPDVELGTGVRARAIAGEAGGVTGPVEGIVTQPLYLDVAMAPRSRLSHPIPLGHTAFAYVYEGRAAFGPEAEAADTAAQHVVVFGDGDRIGATTSDSPARFLLLAARPLREPIARYGPFVMNTREEIAQAVEDYTRGAFSSRA